MPEVTKAHRLSVARAWEGDEALSTFINQWVDGEPNHRKAGAAAVTLESLERLAQLMADAEGVWIPCEERMPEEGTLCVILGEHWSGHGTPPELVTRCGSAATGHWERENVDELDDESPPLAVEYEVTHWMPLPKPPEQP